MPANTARPNGDPLRHELAPSFIAVDLLKPLGQETRKHSPGQIRKLAHSIGTFGLVLPVVIDSEFRVIAGWAVVQAAQRLEQIYRNEAGGEFMPKRIAVRPCCIGGHFILLDRLSACI